MLAIALLMLSAPAVQSPPSPAPQLRTVRREAPPPPLVTGDHASASLDLTLGLPTFSGTIGGKTFKIGFDTGAAGGAHLTDRVVDALKLEPFGEALAGDPSGRNPVRLKLYRIDNLTIGPVSVTNWIGTSAPVVKGKLESIDAIIGLEAFDGFVVTLDYPGHRLLLDRGELPAPNGKTIFSYGSGPIPVVPLTIEGKVLQAHLDTGNASMPLIVPESFAQQLSRRAEARVIGKARTISNEMEIKAVPLNGSVLVGDVPLSAGEAGFPSVVDMGNLGSRALGDVIVRIDSRNHRVEFRSVAPPAPLELQST